MGDMRLSTTELVALLELLRATAMGDKRLSTLQLGAMLELSPTGAVPAF